MSTGTDTKKIFECVSREEVKECLKIEPWKHFACTFYLIFRFYLCFHAIVYFQDYFLIWFFFAIIQGFNYFGCLSLFHECTHDTIFPSDDPHPWIQEVLAYGYCLGANLSRTQFQVYHMDHHNHFMTEKDPKLTYFTLKPKDNTRFNKLLYWTAYLRVIYNNASESAAKSANYSNSLKRRIKIELLLVSIFHLILSYYIIYEWQYGWLIWIKTYLIPRFFFQPIAFMTSRIGQHYSIEGGSKLRHTSRVDGHWWMNHLYFWINYHYEHHSFAKIPCYNLYKMNQLLKRPNGFYQKYKFENYTHYRLLLCWFYYNCKPLIDFNKQMKMNM